ncbi:flagella synthesis protein FlgN [Marinobacterium lutimaris]|uniref:Flagellar biosynthesis/type III secretory pathway chaperone n=1 Tax=Marinobacterium lutimaris TaxID=568106 RepID=A0A1H6BEZ3_9GAMM|nr:flagellar protein FlgN [Marinobacterium lutimaris]SEG58857.1 Flagellar biosynthesis/type III secretory pathway chaperone [Marinobacterium lutimaris]
MSNPQTSEQLHPLITQGVELLRELNELLSEERVALEKRDLDGIQKATELKADLLNRVGANFNERHGAMEAQGIELSAEGWDSFLADLPVTEAKPLADAWIELDQLLEQVQKASQINQQLVHRGQENTARLLNLLQGKNQKSELYGRSGARNNFSTQSRIGKA